MKCLFAAGAAVFVLALVGCGGRVLTERSGGDPDPVLADAGRGAPLVDVDGSAPPPLDGGVGGDVDGEAPVGDDSGAPLDVVPVMGACTSLVVAGDGASHLASFAPDAPFAMRLGPEVHGVDASHVGSIGERGGVFFACDGDVFLVDTNGATADTGVSCGAVAADDSAIWVDDAARGLERYDDASALLRRAPSATFAALGADRISARGSVIVAASDTTSDDGTGAGASTNVRRLDTSNGDDTTFMLNLHGVVAHGIDLREDGELFLVFDLEARGTFTADGHLEVVSTGLVNGQPHGAVCR